ncbi:MAG TPA: bifunctional 23S rRNA (guanine(2069)-N(7))-methyltransferase RlmK/23S rRNA (guanine(2445)-N(2))-methyltransferase RlmL [Candidatus Binatia bacterium]|nr:bifunctional 23S rRNA (guanine(2069)-N(7))-methyltransferase RlmK/23S rRNA (guanine(2445)-N(2))-methyltransferase RlmL [Candidatus Binatia bacterium]
MERALFATVPRGVEPLLAAELAALGAQAVKETGGGVSFAGDNALACRVCLWSRLASRVLLPLHRFALTGTDSIYEAGRTLRWPEIFALERTFAIEVAGRSRHVTHTQFAGLRLKDAIADGFRDATGARPDVDLRDPDVRLHLHLDGDAGTISFDLSGEALHRRGWRKSGVEAPLKENLAAAILVRAGWPQRAAAGEALLDPMCGSGTLPIEAALMAADVAPGLTRARFGFEAWSGHDAALWRSIREEAEARAEAGLARPLGPIVGGDAETSALRASHENARRAGVSGLVRFEKGDVAAARPPAARGVLVANPPYGERMGEENELVKLYSLFGATLKQHFGGWHALVFTARADLAPRLGLRAEKMWSLYNGALPCKLLAFDVAATGPETAGAAGGEDFANRLRKNLKHLGKWARRTGVSCWRAYDADLPDYAVAVDLYETSGRGAGLHAHVQEYAAPKTIDPVKAEKRLREALVQIQQELELPSDRIHYKLRRGQRHREGAQYGRQDERGDFHEIDEHGVKLLVNFDDYLDTGLFLDHRPLRHRIQQEARGKRFLNLFCYTASASAHAAIGGAVQTLSLDLSNTYLDWGRRNLERNGLRTLLLEKPSSRREAHQLMRVDCLEWLRADAHEQYDLILLDPPTFSTSKKMDDTLDLQRDHVELIAGAARRLAPGGTLYFSTNRRGFRLDAGALAPLVAEDVTAQTLDEDFRRPPPSHRCWRLRHGA